MVSQEEIREKMKTSAKNAEVFQQKVKVLNHVVDGIRAEAARKKESIAKLKRKLSEKDHEIKQCQQKVQTADKRLEANKKKAERVRKDIKESEAAFSTLVQTTKAQFHRTGQESKGIQSNYVVKDLAAQRGYTCDANSTFKVAAKKNFLTPRGQPTSRAATTPRKMPLTAR